jgi:hypothetical protein
MVNRLLALMCVAALEVCGVGCAPAAPVVDQPIVVEHDHEEGVWPFWPVTLRIHALTRITLDRTEKTPVLESRVEFLDTESATTKAVGQVLLELTDEGRTGESDLTSEIWTIDLRDLRANATHFDDVTRTYLFKLRLDPARRRHRPHLRVEFHSSNGIVLSDRRAVRPFFLEPYADHDTADDTESDAVPNESDDS